jgi:hypothetical protein
MLFSLHPAAPALGLNLPAINKVDFRARCFETGETVSHGVRVQSMLERRRNLVQRTFAGRVELRCC